MKRIFLCSNPSLFGQGIKHLLDTEADIEIVGWEPEPERAIHCIQSLAPEQRPDIVLLIANDAGEYTVRDGRLFFRAGINARIYEMCLADNNVCIYGGYQVLIDEIDELLEVFDHPLPMTTGE